MQKIKILIAEDNDLSRENLKELLSENGYQVKAVSNGKEAIDVFPYDNYDLVITDLKMPNVDGLQLLKFIKEMRPENVVIMVTGYATVKSAINAMKMGAFDYITKPLKKDFVKLAVERALAHAKLKEENITLKKHLEEKYDFSKIIGYSDGMKKVFEKIKKVASSDSTVAIYGESGTGKELVANALHFNSKRKACPLVTVNCGAIPEDLLESELFGHEKGAFTGAIRSRTGRFELAHGGTIFLDEIGDMSPSLQVKVLRVIQERRFERIGGMKTIDVDIRIITATNQDLEKAVAEKKFREDLFYRINVIPIHLPPLRKRKVDIPVLANHFLRIFNESKEKNIKKLTPEIINCLTKYHWPGNVRELQNLIEMLVVMKEYGDIELEDLPDKIRLYSGGTEGVISSIDIPDNGLGLNKIIGQFEKDLLRKALQKSGGIKNRAAKLLDLNRTTFVEKLKRYKIN
ncbi:MAG: sigma-54-dependent Fis family transcriptional regulator [Deltaproteobacteria bacterium]|nr:sigma-54-dependent Fis family transcriptional regulator [Deltaproteobacteria bacterium]MBW2663018.1 sigma-54-dependent Fis family transcriptional regulator [Deltaproteobacteria bacterium]